MSLESVGFMSNKQFEHMLTTLPTDARVERADDFGVVAVFHPKHTKPVITAMKMGNSWHVVAVKHLIVAERVQFRALEVYKLAHGNDCRNMTTFELQRAAKLSQTERNQFRAFYGLPNFLLNNWS